MIGARVWLGLSVMALLAGCSKVSTPDVNPPFAVDPRQPFHLEFGRGSGWHGLRVFILDESGLARVSRGPLDAAGTWQQTQLQLPSKLVDEVVADINSEKLTHLARTYTDVGVEDGTQWVFLLVQGSHRKVIYFDNNFPEAIKRFSSEVDGVLDRAGIAGADWKPAERSLDKNLWDAVAERK